MKDINLARTPQDLERKYDFSSIGKLKKNYELQKEGLNKIENELSNFAKITTKELEDLKNQVDGNITTWFSSGIPTLENYPTNEWLTDDDKNNHLGDLYYDQDTGYAYRFIQQDGAYIWLKIVDSDVAEALAIANSAKDTADRKRQVFVVEPLPPYDVGDLWIKDEEIYRCQTSKTSGEVYEENDWIKATKYTDDTVANQVGNNLTILSGTVTEIKQNVDELNTKMTNTTELVNENGEKIGVLEEKSSETSQTVESISSTVSEISKDIDTLDEKSLSDDTRIGDLETVLTTIKSTMLEQTSEAFNMWFQKTGIQEAVNSLESALNTNQNSLNTITEYIKFEGAKITLGKSNSIARVVIDNDSIDFMQGDTKVAYIDGNKLYINESVNLTRMQIGHWETVEDDNYNLNTRWVND